MKMKQSNLPNKKLNYEGLLKIRISKQRTECPI